MKEQAGRIGNLPANINIMNPVPNKDAKTITGLIRKNGKVSGYELSDGRVLSKREGVALAKQGGIRGVAIASRNGSEYLRSLPDGSESNNLGDLPFADTQPAPTGAQKAPGRFPRSGAFVSRYLETVIQRRTITRPSSSGARTSPQRTSRRWRTASRRGPGRNGSSCCSALRP